MYWYEPALLGVLFLCLDYLLRGLEGGFLYEQYEQADDHMR